MIEVQGKRNASVVALLEVDPDQIHLYGAATVEATDEDDVVRITGLVEKPSKENAPSNYAIIGRYVLRPEIFDDPRAHRAPGKGGEIQLTDALRGDGRRRTGPAASTASSSAAAATTPATDSTTSRRSCSSPPSARTSGPSCGPGSREFAAGLD